MLGPQKPIVTVMKQTLRNLFKNYGTVLDVVAHRNIRMRGQAFVSFADTETAFKALREVKGFPLYAKPLVRSLFISTHDYALTSPLFLQYFMNTNGLLASIVREIEIRCGCETGRSRRFRYAQN